MENKYEIAREENQIMVFLSKSLDFLDSGLLNINFVFKITI